MTTLFSRIVVLAAVLAVSACSSSSKQESRSLTIEETAGGNGLKVTVSEALAQSVLEGLVGSELECGAEMDSDFAGMLRELDRGGRGSRAAIRDQDGVLTARRSGQKLRMDFDNTDGGGLEVSMPWAVAECLLDGSATLSSHDVDSVRVRLTGEKGGGFELAVD